MIDHRQGCGPDGKKGELWMLWSIACIHCQRTIAVLRRPGGEHVHLSNIDLGLAIPEAMRGAIPPGYVHPYMCRHCHKPICRLCALAMEAAGGDCPGPLEKHIAISKRTGIYRDTAAPLADMKKVQPELLL